MPPAERAPGNFGSAPVTEARRSSRASAKLHFPTGSRSEDRFSLLLVQTLCQLNRLKSLPGHLTTCAWRWRLVAHLGMATAERLGVKDAPGITVGRVVSTGQKFIQRWGDLSIDVWGPRTGESTSRVIPAILDAGAVASTLEQARRRGRHTQCPGRNRSGGGV